VHSAVICVLCCRFWAGLTTGERGGWGGAYAESARDVTLACAAVDPAHFVALSTCPGGIKITEHAGQAAFWKMNTGLMKDVFYMT
jgi:hypothetical protein